MAHYNRQHYEANKQIYKDRAAARKQRLRLERSEYFIEYFKTHPCVDCGETDPVILEFDHLADKSFTISSEMTYRSWESILNEIAKCEVVCVNCHRRRTATRGRWVRATLLSGEN